MSPDDITFLDRAIALAYAGAGRTAPNPMVGCVIVRDGEVVGEGYHQGPGTVHAEPAALAVAGERAKGATAYVSLEPCNHFGSNPPCSQALIRAGVARVVIGARDPNPLASGGTAALGAAGIVVDHAEGDVADRAAEVIRPWVHSLSADRPYTYLKWAGTLDGYLATRSGESKWITGPQARLRGHDLRQRTDAIIVGIGTVLADDPALDPRPDDADPAPSLKVVLDTHLRCPPTARLMTSPGDVLIACGADAADERRAALADAGATVLTLPARDGRLDLRALGEHLSKRGVISAMVEGGGTLHGAFVGAGLVDEVWAFLAPSVMGGGRPVMAGLGPAALADRLMLTNVKTDVLGSDIWIRGQVRKEGC